MPKSNGRNGLAAAVPASATIIVYRVYEGIKTSFWLLPALLTSGALTLAWATIAFDGSAAGEAMAALTAMPTIGVEGARAVLQTIASGMVTTASLVFSLTFVAITLLSQQLGPRILLIFMSDRLTQVVLGVFVAVFLYSLLCLAAIDSRDEVRFVPQISVTLAIAMAMFAFGLMVYFVHHIANVMQADTVVATLGARLDEALRKGIIAEDDETGSDAQAPEAAPEDTGEAVAAPASGYVQIIDFEGAVAVASEHDLQIVYRCRPGYFLIAGQPLASVAGSLSDEIRDKVAGTVGLTERRTPAERAEFETNALVEVALRALSPGINDPYTAIACIDHLSGSLMAVLTHKLRPHVLEDEDGTPRVWRHRQDFRHFLDTAFNPLRHASRGQPMVLFHLARVLSALASSAQTSVEKSAIAAHVGPFEADCKAHIENETDREPILAKLAEVSDLLG